MKQKRKTEGRRMKRPAERTGAVAVLVLLILLLAATILLRILKTPAAQPESDSGYEMPAALDGTDSPSETPTMLPEPGSDSNAQAGNTGHMGEAGVAGQTGVAEQMGAAGQAGAAGQTGETGQTGEAGRTGGSEEPGEAEQMRETGRAEQAGSVPSGDSSQYGADHNGTVNGGQNDAGGTPKRYTAETYQLVTDIVYAYRTLGAEGWPTVETSLKSLKETDPELGKLWQGIMDAWVYSADELKVNDGVLPDGLPQDDSLCIAVLGYQLLYDGQMAPELRGRCEAALRSLQKYPNAYLAVTGGGTAMQNKEVTEAEVMAEWFRENGISEDRIIVENRSMTTDQNAKNTCAILTEQFPQVKQIAVITSEYHVPLGALMFTEAALLYAYSEDAEAPYTVVSNAGFDAAGTEEYTNPAHWWTYVWIMADPNY